MMDLDKFITATLTAIIKGVKDCEEIAKQNGAVVNPIQFGDMNNGTFIENNDHKRPLTLVDFDVAVTTSSTNDKGIEGGVKVLSINFGGKDITEQSQAVVSRIKFKVSAVLPHNMGLKNNSDNYYKFQ